MINSSRQFKRVAQVLIGKDGQGLLVENLRIQFEIIKSVDAEPNSAVIKIYNLTPDNEAKIKNEYDEIIVNAGYKDSVRLIFRGNIKHAYRYREGNDRITEIEAGDGDDDFRNAIMNETLAAGTNLSQTVTRAVGSFSSTSQGEIQIVDKQRLRGKVFSGNTRTILEEIATDSGANWSIQDGQLQIVKVDGVLKGEAIVINADTGMLSAPEANDKGIAVECLLNPQIRINGTILLDNNSIRIRYGKQKKLATAAQREQAKKTDPVRLDPDGLYKVIKMTHKGDTRGNEWFTVSECIGIGQPIPASRSAA